MSSIGQFPPQVLLVCDYFIRNETGLAQGLRAQGWEPILLGRDHQHAFGGQAGALRAYIDQRLGSDQRRLLLDGRARDLKGWRSLRTATREVRELAPSITHVQMCICHDPRLLIAAGLRPQRYAVTVHDVDSHPGDRPQPRRHSAIQRLLVRNAGLVFVHAETLRDELIDRGITRAPVVAVPLGVDDAPTSPAPFPPPARSSLLFFGRLSRYKGLDILLEAVSELWQSRPDLTLTIAGEGPLAPHPALGDPRLRIVNRYIDNSELPGLFSEASVVVLPYVEASQSGVGTMAKAYGRPIVASAVGGLPELLSDGSGLLVPPGDPRPLARALDELLSDPVGQAQMREAGLRTVRERSGWPAVAAVTLDAYARYLGAPDRRRVAQPMRGRPER